MQAELTEDTKTHANASIYNPCDRNNSCVSPQLDSYSKWNKPRMESYTIKACSLVYFWINLSWSLLVQNLIYSKYKRFMQTLIILPQVQPCNHNPVNLTEYKKNKEMKTKEKAQTQEVWRELSCKRQEGINTSKLRPLLIFRNCFCTYRYTPSKITFPIQKNQWCYKIIFKAYSV